jgi:hypothetical protein
MLAALPEELAPVKYLLGGVGRLVSGFKGALKDKKKLIPAIVMTLIWLVLTILPLLGADSSLFRLLSFLTFAWGGLGAGVLGAIGGTIGKGICVYFITSMILPLFSGKNPFAGMERGIKTMFGLVAALDRKSLVPLLAGGGTALIAYNVLTGNASLHNSMIGIVGGVLTLRALSNKAGFLRGFLVSVINKLSKRSAKDRTYINRVLAGATSGFALSVPLSAMRISFICYLAGIAALLAAVIMETDVFFKVKKGVVTRFFVVGCVLVLSCATGAAFAAGSQPEGLPYNDTSKYSYHVLTSARTDDTQNYFGLVYNITVRDKKSGIILSTDSLEIGFTGISAEKDEYRLLHEGFREVHGKKKRTEYASSDVSMRKNLSIQAGSLAMGRRGNSDSSWNKFKSEEIRRFENDPQAALRGRRSYYEEGKFWGRDALFLLIEYDAYNGGFGTSRGVSGKSRSYWGTIYVYFDDVTLPTGYENTIVIQINFGALGWAEAYSEVDKKAAARAEELFSMAKRDLDNRLSILNAIPVTVKRTVGLREYAVKEAAPAQVRQTVSGIAAGNAGETAVAVLTVIVTGVAAAAAGAAGAAMGGTAGGGAATAGGEAGGEGSNGEEGSSSTYKMCIYKDFGDKIKYNSQPLYIYARMVEINAEGMEIDRFDLTRMVEIFPGEGPLDVGANVISGIYMGASVRAVSANPSDMVPEGTVSFRFTGEGGVFQNNVRFKLAGAAKIKLEEDALYMLATSADSFKLKYELVDFDVQPEVEVVSGSDLIELRTGKNDAGEDIIIATPTSAAAQKPFESFVHSYPCEITAKNEKESVTSKFDLRLCYEGIGTAWKGTDNNKTKGAFIIQCFTDEGKDKREEAAFRLPLAVMRWNNNARRLEPDTGMAGGLKIEITADTKSGKLAAADAERAVEEADITVKVEAGPSLAEADQEKKPATYMVYPEKSTTAAVETIDLLVTISCGGGEFEDLCLKAELKPQNDFGAMIRWFIEYSQGTMAARYITLADVDTYLGALEFIENRVYSMSSVPFTPRTKENHYEDGKLDVVRPRCIVLRDDSMPHQIGEFKKIQSLFHELTHTIEDQNGDIGVIFSGGNPERHTYFLQYLSDALKDLADMERNPSMDAESAVQSAIASFNKAFFNPDFSLPFNFQWFGTKYQTQHAVFDRYADFHIYCDSSNISAEQKQTISRLFRKNYFPGSALGKFNEIDGFFKGAVWTFVWSGGWLKDLRVEHPGFKFSAESARQWAGGNRLALAAVYHVESLSTGKTDMLNVELDAGTFDPADYSYPPVSRFNVKWGATYKISDCIMGKSRQMSEAVKT